MVILISLLGVLVVVAIVAATAVSWHLVRRERTTRQALDAVVLELQHDRDTLLRRRSVERDLEHRLEHAESEGEVIALVRAALRELDAKRPFELHLVHEHEPYMTLAFATGATPPGASDVTSPWDSIAARDGTTLVYATTDTDDICPHLRARLVEHCSAICIPLLAMGRIVGVLYAMGPVGAEPSPQLVETYETIARAAAANVATVRAFGHRSTIADLDRHDENDEYDDHDDRGVGATDHRHDVDHDLTDWLHDVPGLGDRADALAVIDELITTGRQFAMLLFDIDDLGGYQVRCGPRAAEAALQTVAAVAARHLGDAGRVHRIDNDRFVAPLAEAAARDALAAADHIRHILARTIDEHDLDPFTVSFGVVEAGAGTSAERVLLSATDALHNARARGNDRVVVGIDVGSGTA